MALSKGSLTRMGSYWSKRLCDEREWREQQGEELRCADCGCVLGSLFVRVWDGDELKERLCRDCADARVRRAKEGRGDG